MLRGRTRLSSLLWHHLFFRRADAYIRRAVSLCPLRSLAQASIKSIYYNVRLSQEGSYVLQGHV